MIHFESPWVFFIVVPLWAAFAFFLRKVRLSDINSRRKIHAGLLLVAAVCLGLCASGMKWIRSHDAKSVVIVIDRSRSTDVADEQIENYIAQLHRVLPTMQEEDRIGLVVTAEESVTVLLPSTQKILPLTNTDISRDNTNLEVAIRQAVADIPDQTSGHIVLITDGIETQGDAIIAAHNARARGVQVDVLPLTRSQSADIAVREVRAPASANKDEPIEIRVLTTATQQTKVKVRLRRDGSLVATGESEIRQGHDLLLIRDTLETSGLHRYDVEIEAIDDQNDLSQGNDEGSTFIRVTGDSQTLIIAESHDHILPLIEGIQEIGMSSTYLMPSQVPYTLEELLIYDLIILVDVQASRFTEAQIENFAAFERDLGGGLWMIGARQSFGLGGWSRTPLEDVMPVTFDIRSRRDRLSLSLVMAIDQSGSMSVTVPGGRKKIDLANEAAARSASMLAPTDRVAVAHVDTEVHWTQPMTRVEDPARIAARVRQAQSGGGGIYVDVALDASYQALAQEQTQLAHLILFSDGGDSEQLEGCRARVSAAYQKHITTSVVSMGRDHDTPELEALSRLGHGRFYIVEDMTQLPRIFTQETMEASRSGIAEKSFKASVVENGAQINGIDFQAAPPLSGLAIVEARRNATIHLRAAPNEPLLAQWQHGLGRSAVLTTDLGGEFAQNWLQWSQFQSLLGQISRDLARQKTSDQVEPHVSIEGSRGHIWVDMIDETGHLHNHLDLKAGVAGPRGSTATVALLQTRPGRYEADFDASVQGSYLITLQDEDLRMIGLVGTMRPHTNELSGAGTDHEKMAAIAVAGGGHVLRNVNRIFRERPVPIKTYVPAFPWLLATSLIAFLFAIAIRRLDGLFEQIKAFLKKKLMKSNSFTIPSTQTIDTLVEKIKPQRSFKNQKNQQVNQSYEWTIPVETKTRKKKIEKSSDTSSTELKEDTTPPLVQEIPLSLAEKLLEKKKKK